MSMFPTHPTRFKLVVRLHFNVTAKQILDDEIRPAIADKSEGPFKGFSGHPAGQKIIRNRFFQKAAQIGPVWELCKYLEKLVGSGANATLFTMIIVFDTNSAMVDMCVEPK